MVVQNRIMYEQGHNSQTANLRVRIARELSYFSLAQVCFGGSSFLFGYDNIIIII